MTKVSTADVLTTTTIDSSSILSRQGCGRVDYGFFNYCAICDLKLSKLIFRCPHCRHKIRTKPCHNSKIRQFKRM